MPINKLQIYGGNKGNQAIFYKRETFGSRFRNYLKGENSMEKKKGRGRPTVTENWFGESAASYEAVIMGGKKRCTRRTISDTAYAYTAMSILLEAASEIEDLKLLFNEETQYMCRSVLNQLGRMHRTEGYNKESIVYIAKAAIKAKKNGYSVKEIERYIRNGRVTDEW